MGIFILKDRRTAWRHCAIYSHGHKIKMLDLIKAIVLRMRLNIIRLIYYYRDQVVTNIQWLACIYTLQKGKCQFDM